MGDPRRSLPRGAGESEDRGGGSEAGPLYQSPLVLLSQPADACFVRPRCARPDGVRRVLGLSRVGCERLLRHD
jgi:hypothetical protein